MPRSALVTVLGLVLASAAPAFAQTMNPRADVARPVMTVWAEIAPVTPKNETAYDRLSPGNRRIARAIFEAQTSAAGTLTLDQIAALKDSGQGGWRRVYADMRARGLVTEKTLGQALSRYNRANAPGE
jgi:hypothetical protein